MEDSPSGGVVVDHGRLQDSQEQGLGHFVVDLRETMIDMDGI